MLKRGSYPTFTLSRGRQFLLISCVFNTLPGISHAGDCTGTAGNYTCSGVADVATDVSQLLSGSPLAVTTTPGFGIITDAGDAITLQGTGGLIFNDNNQSIISGFNSGISAVNSESGSLSITTTGTVSGQSNGIDANNELGTADLVLNSTDVVGGLLGVNTYNYGSGKTSITSTGSIIGRGDAGIDVRNTDIATSLTIHANNVTGYGFGINAVSAGSEGLSIVTTGTVRGDGPDGVAISASNSYLDFIIQSVDVFGESTGILAINESLGVLSITSTGTVTGGTSSGIDAASIYGALAAIQVNNVSGGTQGISAVQYNGALSITSTGRVTGSSGAGIEAHNAGTDLTINAVDVSGGTQGILADQSGVGALSISSTGLVSGSSDAGIDAYNAGTDLTLNVADISGGTKGILAVQVGAGALSISSTGLVSGSSGAGIDAYNTGTDLTINVADISGGTQGIFAVQEGEGALSISSTGLVSGSSGAGIDASNTGTDLTLNVADISGGTQGIFAVQEGEGALSISSTGRVTGSSGIGIDASNTGTDLTINVADVFGGIKGIFAVQDGEGALSISSTGLVSGSSGAGIDAYNTGTDLTINVADVFGGIKGIFAVQQGEGALSISSTGLVSGSSGAGIDAYNTGTDLTLNVADISGGTQGIFAVQEGEGALSISSTGLVSGSSGAGIDASSIGTDLTLNVADVSGGTQGIFAQQEGEGALSISSTGLVSGSSGAGIDAYNTGTDLTLNVADISGGTQGIFAVQEGVGALSISSTGLVTGSSGAGIDASSIGTDLTINVADVSGATSGIKAVNSANGGLSITTRGLVEGTSTIPGEGYGINATNTGSDPLLIMVDATSTVQGGTGAIFTNSTEAFDITNRGTIRNLSRVSSDLAIHNSGNEGTIHNQGLILGTLELVNNVINHVGGIWNSAGGSSHFGSFSAANSLINNGLIITANGSAVDPIQSTTFNNVGTFTNSGSLSMGNGRMGDITIINGDYVGNNGEIVFDIELGDDNSRTDKLQINGNTSGTSFVTFNHRRGNGGKSIEGTELITVSGQSDGEFMHTDRIVAGAYDYFLTRGQNANASNWYLSGRLQQSVAQGEAESPMVERPEDGAYTANLAAANTMFVTRLHDRLGETHYLDVLTGEKRVTSMWLRNVGGHNRSRDESGQLRTQANRYVMQLGGDLAHWSVSGQDRFELGVMAGYGNNQSSTISSLSGYQAKGKVDGYSTGVYGIWRANEADKAGMYMDVWVQYSWLNNTVSGEGLPQESYKSKGMTGSFEVGYLFNLGENAANNWRWFIQPQAQVVMMGVKADEHTETSGTYVSGEGHNNTQARLGVRAFANGYSELDKGKNRVFQPFVEANWIYNSKDFGTQMDGVSVTQAGAANIAELKVGVEGQLNQHVKLWGNIAQQVGDKGYSDSAAMLGVKYSF